MFMFYIVICLFAVIMSIYLVKNQIKDIEENPLPNKEINTDKK